MAQITGYNKNDVLYGTDTDDSILGGGGDDVLKGMGGNDFFYGDQGADVIKGGGGIDTVDYWNFSTTGVWVDLASGTGSGGLASGDQYIGIENVGGTKFNDVITGDDGDNRVRGYDGNDVLKGGGGADDLMGDDGDDTIKGGAGSDILDGGRGFDQMLGGTGDDFYWATYQDTLVENSGEGYDTVYALGDFVLPDNIEALELRSHGAVNGTGNAQGNTILGNDFDNVIDGGGGADALVGYGGNDTFVFKAGQANGDHVYGFTGNGAGVGDTIRFEGYGTIAQGATFHQIGATEWQVNSADGLRHETIYIEGPVDTLHDLVFV